jgi:trans-2,3-dihydro-3-hydroxyanthranilate isomerase
LRKVRFIQADVFSDSPFGGNPVVVVPEPGPMTDEEMQALARGMTFSETAFVTTPKDPSAAFALRCFTPTTEVQFSAHQLLGAAYVLAGLGRLPTEGERTELQAEVSGAVQRVTLEHPAGLVERVSIVERVGAFGSPIDDVGSVAEALSIDPMAILRTSLPVQVVETGLRCLIVPVDDLHTVRNLLPLNQAVDELLQDHSAHCLLVFSRQTLAPKNDLHVRVFAPPLGIDEDPATGTANGALAAYLIRHGDVVADPTVSLSCEQGFEMGRPSRIELIVDTSSDPTTILVGGRVARSVDGTVFY